MKGYCLECKNITFGSHGLMLCRASGVRQPEGNYIYAGCRDINKDFKCEDFNPKFRYKRKYRGR